MKNFLTCLSFLFFLQMSDAQSLPEKAVVTFQPYQMNRASLQLNDGQIFQRASVLGAVPLKHSGPFIAYSIVWYAEGWGGNDRMEILFSVKNNEPLIQQIHPETHALATGNRHVSELYFLENEFTQFRVHFTGTNRIDSLAIHFYNPGFTKDLVSVSDGVFSSPGITYPSPSSSTVATRSACACPQPAYQGRQDWCPAGNCPPNPSPSPTNVGYLIVHHSAGSNTSSDWAAVVRSIWNFHVNVNGWSDIGYNWLIDPNGVLYEGRGDNVVGAHFCGTNGGTMGVCVMGDFTNITPSAGAINKLEALLAWKCCDRELDPLGSGVHASSGLMLKRISGHRDGCSTSCPGDSFYPLLPDIREEVAGLIAGGCDATSLAGVRGSVDQKIHIFPNPTSEDFSVIIENQWIGKVEVSVFDGLGRQVGLPKVFEKNNPKLVFDMKLGGGQEGVFWVKIERGGEISFFKILKQ